MIDPRSTPPESAALPPRGASRREVEAWRAGMAVPLETSGAIDELAAIARQVETDMGAASVADLQATTYLRWRSACRNGGLGPEDIRAIGVVIDELWGRGDAPTSLDGALRPDQQSGLRVFRM